MEALNERITAIEEMVGHIGPNRQPLHADLEAIRANLRNLKVDLMLTTPIETLRILLKEENPNLEDILTLREKLFYIEYHQPQLEKYLQQLTEMDRLAQVVLDSKFLCNIPDIGELASVKSDLIEVEKETRAATVEVMDFLRREAASVNEMSQKLRDFLNQVQTRRNEE